MRELLDLLEEAEMLASEFTGGYSNHFSSAEEFHEMLANAIEELKHGSDTVLNEMRVWFAPTCDWDDLIGKDGEHLANRIYSILSGM